MLYVTGHRSPDTDSVASAIAYAELKRKLGQDAVACRLGDINPETDFVLKRFGFEPPMLLETVKTRVSDLDLDPSIPVSPDCTLKVAWTLMKRNKAKILPIVDDSERMTGVATLSDLTEHYMDSLDNEGLSIARTPLVNLVETLGASVVGDISGRVVEGKVAVLAMTADRVRELIEGCGVVIVGNRTENQMSAIEMGIPCLVLTCGSPVEDCVAEAARAADCVILTTHCDTFTASRLINLSLPVRHVMTTEVTSFDMEDFVDDVREIMLRTRYRSYPVLDERGRVHGMVARYHLISHKRKRVVLVDHNERAQSVPGIEEAEIVEIIDHHRVGDVQTGGPILFRNEPVGSTATIVSNIYEEHGLRPSPGVAGLLCSAILSDTLRFKSPTSTQIDRLEADRLCGIAGIRDMDAYTAELFRASASLEGRDPRAIIKQDLKEYQIGDLCCAVAQIFTPISALSPDMKASIHQAMDAACAQKGYQIFVLMITDPLEEGSTLFIAGESREILRSAYGAHTEEQDVPAPGVMSRKKQLLPKLVRAFESV